jgi:hypothetical protein
LSGRLEGGRDVSGDALIVFDARGEPWSASSVALQRALNSSIGGNTLAEYTVVNMGFVAAEDAGRALHIKVRPAIAAGAALAGLFYWLHGRSAKRVVVSSFEEKRWSHALLGSREEAITKLAALSPADPSLRNG